MSSTKVKPGSNKDQQKRRREKEEKANAIAELERLREADEYIPRVLAERERLGKPREIDFTKDIHEEVIKAGHSDHSEEMTESRKVERERLLGALSIENKHNRLFVSSFSQRDSLYGFVRVRRVASGRFRVEVFGESDPGERVPSEENKLLLDDYSEKYIQRSSIFPCSVDLERILSLAPSPPARSTAGAIEGSEEGRQQEGEVLTVRALLKKRNSNRRTAFTIIIDEEDDEIDEGREVKDRNARYEERLAKRFEGCERLIIFGRDDNPDQLNVIVSRDYTKIVTLWKNSNFESSPNSSEGEPEEIVSVQEKLRKEYLEKKKASTLKRRKLKEKRRDELRGKERDNKMNRLRGKERDNKMNRKRREMNEQPIMAEKEVNLNLAAVELKNGIRTVAKKAEEKPGEKKVNPPAGERCPHPDCSKKTRTYNNLQKHYSVKHEGAVVAAAAPSNNDHEGSMAVSPSDQQSQQVIDNNDGGAIVATIGGGERGRRRSRPTAAATLTDNDGEAIGGGDRATRPPTATLTCPHPDCRRKKRTFINKAALRSHTASAHKPAADL